MVMRSRKGSHRTIAIALHLLSFLTSSRQGLRILRPQHRQTTRLRPGTHRGLLEIRRKAVESRLFATPQPDGTSPQPVYGTSWSESQPPAASRLPSQTG